MSKEAKLKPCPFCGEEGFDNIGLKSHLQNGYCEEYNTTKTLAEEKESRNRRAK